MGNMMTGGIMEGAGALMHIAGTYLEANAKKMAQRRMQEAINEPGVDTGALTGQALADQLRFLPQSTALASQISAANQANVNAQEEAAMPGVRAAREAALGRINGLFADDATWLKGVQRRGAALGLSSGLGGSQAGQLRTLQLSDREQMARTQLGTGLLGSLISGLRVSQSPGVEAFLGPTPAQLINLRANERTQKVNLMAQYAGMPGATQVWADNLHWAGATLIGQGSGMMGGSSSTPPQPTYGGGGGNQPTVALLSCRGRSCRAIPVAPSPP